MYMYMHIQLAKEAHSQWLCQLKRLESTVMGHCFNTDLVKVLMSDVLHQGECELK